jgi:hypothetical protein
MSVTDVFPTSEGSFDEDLTTGRMSQKYRHPGPTFFSSKKPQKHQLILQYQNLF